MSLRELLGLDILQRYGGRLLDGMLLTLELVAISAILGLVLGLSLALVRLHTHRLLSGLARLYIAFFRGTPILLQLFLFYYGAGQLREPLEIMGLWELFREPFFCAVLTFTLNTAAYQAEILRGAIASLPSGQAEAAAALGLGPDCTCCAMSFCRRRWRWRCGRWATS